MNKSMLVGAVLGAVGVTAGGAVATYSVINSAPKYAQVLAVQPVKETIKTPRQVCKDVTVTKQKPVQDQHKIAGTVVGALAGGLLGNQIGGGSGKKVATAAGVVGGAVLGNKIEKDRNSSTQYDVVVQYDAGGSDVFSFSSPPSWQSGDRVKVVNGQITSSL